MVCKYNLEEDGKCPECGKLGLSFAVHDCSCHINPPCGSCTSAVLTCAGCGFEDDSPDESYRLISPPTEAPYLYEMVEKEKPLDATKISYRIRAHTHFSQKCVGVYPEADYDTPAAAQAAVLKKVKGTFGGRFDKFGGGKFTYVAYTD